MACVWGRTINYHHISIPCDISLLCIRMGNDVAVEILPRYGETGMK